MGCTSELCQVSTGLHAHIKDWLGGACAFVPNKLTDGLKVRNKHVEWRSWYRNPCGTTVPGAIRSRCVVTLRRSDGGSEGPYPK